MKIILSPSKTQDFSIKVDAPSGQPVFHDQALHLNALLKKLSKDEIASLMNIKNQLLEDTYSNIHSFGSAETNHAIATYTGLVYKYFDRDAYQKEEIDYLNSHLTLLSAQYGVLRPYDVIAPYRLDMKMKPGGMNLYHYWQPMMDDYFKKEETIIDLASGEFSKMVKGNKITVGFRDYKDGKYKNLATYSKMARGMLLHQMVLNKTDSIEALKQLTFDTYSYNEEISTDRLLLFTRNSG